METVNIMRKLTHFKQAFVLFAFLAFCCAGYQADAASITIDEALDGLKHYAYGQNDKMLHALEKAFQASRLSGEHLEKVDGLLLDGKTSIAAKRFLCRQLCFFGKERHVSVLKKLLSSKETAEMARQALEKIPGKSATSALCEAAKTAEGNLLTGIIHSLGMRRDHQALACLKEILQKGDKASTRACIFALGEIGSAEAFGLLKAAQARSGSRLSGAIADAQLDCADGLKQKGLSKDAESIYAHVWKKGPTRTARLGGLSGLASCGSEASTKAILEAAGGRDKTVKKTAIKLTGRVSGKKVTLALCGMLEKSGEDDQLLILAALGERGDPSAIPVLNKFINNREGPLFEAALKALAACGDREAKLLLAETSSNVSRLTPPPYGPADLLKRRKQVAAKAPAGHQLACYVDCGIKSRDAKPKQPSIILLNGSPYQWPDTDSAASKHAGTIVFDANNVDILLSNLNVRKDYIAGVTWWDFDHNTRKQSIRITGGKPLKSRMLLPSSKLPNFNVKKEPASELTLPLDPAFTANGEATLSIRREGLVNAVVSEVWLYESTEEKERIVKKEAPPARTKKILMITGIDYPGHKWKETAPALKALLEEDRRLKVTVSEDMHFLGSLEIHQYDAMVLHFMNWKKPAPGDRAKENLKQFVSGGKGLVLVHFACGAFQKWPEFKHIAGRVWDPKLRGHDPHGTFKVVFTEKGKAHPATKGLKDFEIRDELYTCLAGDLPVELLATSRSKVDGKDYPMAFVFKYGKGKVFHSPLGHDVHAFSFEGARLLFQRGCAWVAGLD